MGYQIETTPEQDSIMREEFKNIAETEYDVITNNCAIAVQKTLIKGGLNVDLPRDALEVVLYYAGYQEVVMNVLPGKAYILIKWLNEGKEYEKTK